MSVIRFHSLPAIEVEERLFQKWENIHQEQEFSSPFTHPQFTRCLAEVRPSDTWISIMEADNEIIGFFPYQQKRRRRISPLGEFLNDYQAPVAKKGYSWDAAEWIKQSSFNWFTYNHLPEQQKSFHRYSPIRTFSPVMEVSGGFDRYLARLANIKGKIPGSFTRTDRSKRKRLIDEIGDVVFLSDSRDHEHFQSLLFLKSQQYRETGAVDIFAVPWVSQLIGKLFQQRGRGFSGKLSVLMAGDKVVSYHFGLGSGNVWHYWFPAFDRIYAPYSVGILLLIEMAKAAADEGFDWIDLGRGDQRYKMELKTSGYGLQEGILSRPQWRGDLTMRQRVTWTAFKQSRFGESLKRIRNVLINRGK